MSVEKLHFLKTGRCGVAAWMLDTQNRPAGMLDLPIWAYLIETTDGPILIDTGMPDEMIGKPDLFTQPGREPEIVPRMTADDTILAALGRAGYQPSDLLCLVNTHTHFDHSGGNRHFHGVEVVIQKAEYDAAIANRGADPSDFWNDAGLNYRIVEGDVELVPGVRLLFTPGHTVGHQSVLVTTPKTGAVLLTVDASYCRANFEDGIPFAGADEGLELQSIAKLREIAKAEQAFVFYGHDTVQETQVDTYPAAY
ncbi:MAG: N-acyl homoserine lactonase family protein [Alicyclobacillus sp.]|nr:N-acyl homoserine lactonase family protein [Alicyclobacillus sp.]